MRSYLKPLTLAPVLSLLIACGGEIIIGDDDDTVTVDRDNDGFEDGDCDDNDAGINPDADEICDDRIDNNCDGYADCTDDDCVDDSDCEDDTVDDDGDGYTDQIDCDDDDPSVHPGAREDCEDDEDRDCDGTAGEDDPACDDNPDPRDVDNDGDGYSENEGDCDDTEPLARPAGSEDGYSECDDGIDNDCDDDIDCDDSACRTECDSGDDDDDDDDDDDTAGDDADGDGFIDEDDGGTDCDDGDDDVHPGADEICEDGVDNDCDDRIDEGCDDPDPIGGPENCDDVTFVRPSGWSASMTEAFCSDAPPPYAGVVTNATNGYGLWSAANGWPTDRCEDNGGDWEDDGDEFFPGLTAWEAWGSGTRPDLATEDLPVGTEGGCDWWGRPGASFAGDIAYETALFPGWTPPWRDPSVTEEELELYRLPVGFPSAL